MITRILLAFFAFLTITNAQILNVAEAFKVVSNSTQNGVEFYFKFGENIYIYKDTFSVLLGDKNINKQIKLPAYEVVGEYNIVLKEFTLFVPKELILAQLKDNKTTITLNYQGCAKNGICYRPQVKIYDVLANNNELNVSEAGTQTANTPTQNTQELSEDERIAHSLLNSNFVISLATFFGYGLLLALTPCIFPMIPILSSIIVAKGGAKLGVKKGFIFALVYVIAMSLAYALAGIVASFAGAGVQGALQNAWVLGTFSLVFVALAFSMFGFYELHLPAKFENFISRRSQNGSGLIGVFVMGFASALVVSPCVAAPLAGALLYIAQSGNAVFGGIMLFVMGLGMGVPLLLIGASSGKILPRPGAWMDAIKMAFGFVMLGMAVWLASRIFGSAFELAGYGVLGVFIAVYFGAFEAAISGMLKFKKSIALLIFIYSLMLIVGAFSGGKNIFSPLENFGTSLNVAQKDELKFRSITNLAELKNAINSAQKPLMIDFYADWCASCKEIEHITFADENVKNSLKNFELIRIDVTKSNKENDEMLKNFGLIDPPALLFFKDGIQLSSKRIIGFVKPEKFLEKISEI